MQHKNTGQKVIKFETTAQKTKEIFATETDIYGAKDDKLISLIKRKKISFNKFR